MKLRYNGKTHVGQRRETNQDSFGPEHLLPDEPAGQLLVVCDGMGGHAFGEVASRIGVETILGQYYAATNDDKAAVLQDAFEQANSAIYTEGRGNMGTTGVAALFADGGLVVANVGDSRAYLVHDGQIGQISHDHSLVAEQVQAGLLTPEQARVSTIKNFITRALGHQPDVQVDIFRLPVRVGDIVVLCSDGLHGLVEDDEIREAVTLLQPEEATETLIRLANERGGTDNITVVIARVERLDGADGQQEQPARAAPITLELPERDDPPPASAAALPEQPAPAAAPPLPPPTPVERPLSRTGLLLSLFTLALLLTVGLYVLLTPAPVLAPVVANPTVAAPTATLTPTRLPATTTPNVEP